MTKDEIIKLAEEAFVITTDGKFGPINLRMVEHFANLVAAAEREACAKLCERDDSMRWSGAAVAIRARSQS